MPRNRILLARSCRPALWLSAALLCLPLSQAPQAEIDPLDAPLLKVEFRAGDTLRGVVGDHLRDPDLWPAVLALNNIASPADLRPGDELQLPVRQVMAADAALLRALSAIQTATAEGARIFAPREIGAAIDNRDTAVTRREKGDWRQVVDYAGLATGQANQALDISITQRDRAAEAVVSDVHGTVEGRAPAEPSWSGRTLDDILVEFERLRTLSNSTTQVTFRDLSRLRLNPNSNATIQRMRSDPLTGDEVTKVSLANGDFYALLNQLTEKSAFEIEVPGIETTTNSADFWIKSDQTGARFVNYDTAALSIERGGDQITLGENQGVVLTGAQAQRADVLDSPLLQAPAVGAVIHTGAAALRWQAQEGAAGYWLEVARDVGFNQMQISEWGLRDTGFAADALAPGVYHWRVAALDQLGLPGQWSTPRDFTLREDVTPPFLTLLSPADGSLVTAPQIELLGASERDVALTVNGTPLEVAADGSFLTQLPLQPGENAIALRAVDVAGNDSTRSVTVTYRPAAQVQIMLDDRIPRVGQALASRAADLSLRASSDAAPDAPVVLRDETGAVVVQTRVGPDGAITLTVPVEGSERAFTLQILSPGGTVEGTLGFTALRDEQPPQITLDQPPPRATGDATLVLSGGSEDAVALYLGDTAVPLARGRFDLTLTLTPGENAFDLRARDAVGNLSLLRLATRLDIDPPDITSVDLSRPQGATGPIELRVQASDASGLRQAAPFVIAVGGDEISGFARCDSASGICRASLPPRTGTLELIELIVEDHADNAAFY